MSQLYESGRKHFDVDDYVKAMDIYVQGDALEDIYCSFGFAQLLINGWGIDKDENRAKDIFSRTLPILKIKAENGDALAQSMIGVAYGNGYFVQKDASAARNWFKRSAKQENVYAQFNLAIIYTNGIGVKKSNKNACVWLKKAAGQGHAKAQEQLAFCFQHGKGLEKSPENAVYWYNKAVQQGKLSAILKLADMYYYGVDVERNYNKAFELYYMAAKKENVDAEFKLGVIYDNGYGVEQNVKEAIYWFEKAALHGCAESQFNLGLMYSRGEGGDINLGKSAEWMLRSAENGYRDAQWLMSRKYKRGDGVKKSIEKSIFWLEKAALNGKGAAGFELGNYHRATNNIKKAIDWFEKGFYASEPYVDCAWALGSIYEFGDESIKSYRKAIYWHKKGAENECAESQDRLREIYAYGIGTKNSAEKAFYWSSKALTNYIKYAEQGDTYYMEKVAEYKINGYGCDVNVEEGNLWYKKYLEKTMPLAMAGDAKEQCNIADAYLDGKGVEQSYEEAEHWYKRAAEQGFIRAKKKLSEIYSLGLIGKIDGNKAIDLLSELQEYSQVGDIYKNGLGVAVDLNKAEYWYKKGCEKEDSFSFLKLALFYTEHRKEEKGIDIVKLIDKITTDSYYGDIACWILADCYKEGTGVEKDDAKAMELYRKSFIAAKNQGTDLTRFYYSGIGTRKNYKKVISLCLADSESRHSQNMLGIMYANGLGVKRDYKEALNWYKLATHNGCAESALALGELYYFGRGCEQDYGKAVKYFEKANQVAGYSAPFYYLGDCYHHGLGVKPDWQKAKNYYEKAIALGYNCEYALEMVKIDLGEYRKVAEMEKYAKSLANLKLSGEMLKNRISQDLEKDFGDNWEYLKENAKIGLTTGVLTYITFLSMGEDFCKQLDFSAIIVNFAKALEVELAEYFYKGYIRYLKKRNISPYAFPEDACFLNIKKENGIEKTREYQRENLIKNFKLGGLKFIIDDQFETMPSVEIAMHSKSTLGRRSETYRKFKNFKGDAGIRTIDKHMLAYANELFSKEAFTATNRKKEIVNYLIDLSNAVGEIAYQYRNPAAHGDIMVKDKASACGDYLIKVRKLIYGFLSKIKKKYRNGFEPIDKDFNGE